MEPTLKQLAAQCADDSMRWFGDMGYMTSHDRQLMHYTIAMGGESGEFLNVVKKIDRGDFKLGDPLARIRLAEELTDTMVYALNLAALLGIDLMKSYNVVRGKNETRFIAMRAKREAERNAH